MTFSRPYVKTIKQLWLQSPVAASGQLEFWTYRNYPDRLEARLHVIKLFYQGWNKNSMSRFLHVSRPTQPSLLNVQNMPVEF